MKKSFIMISLLGILAACGGGNSSEKTEEKKTEEAPAVKDITQDPDYQKGVEIAGKSDCATCHKIEEKLIGPAWRDVANKYAGQDTAVKYLAHKIKKGGSGVWGDVPMAEHPTLSEEDAETLARYVLLLKNKSE